MRNSPSMATSKELSDCILSDIPRLRLRLEYVDIKDMDLILDTKDCGTVRGFLKPWGQQHVTIIHLAAYSGRLEVLKRAAALEVDLYVTDKVGRCALHYAAGQGQLHIVRWFVERSNDNYQLSRQDSSGKTALHLAVHEKHVEIVKLLVNAGVDPNIRDKGKMTPLHFAWTNVNRHDPTEMSRYEGIVDTLVFSSQFTKFVDEPLRVFGKIFSTTVLNCAVCLNSPGTTKKLLEHGLIITRPYQTQEMTTPLHIAAEHGFHQTLCVLLKYRHFRSWMINMRDKMGQTPLHVAVSEDHLKCAHTLVKNGGSLVSYSKNGLTVIETLFRYAERPIAFLTDLLDAGVQPTGGNINKVTLNFEVLAPQDERQMAVVSTLISTIPSMKQMEILRHPLVDAFLRLKWMRLSYFFVFRVIFQAAFAVCISAYGILLQNKGDLLIPRWILFVCAIIMFFHNILQLVLIPKYYCKQFETWLSIICSTICIVVPVVGEFGFDHSERTGLPHSWVLQSISVAILLACIQMMLLIGQFPPWGYYALMFYTVLTNVLKVFLPLIWIILGFSLSFLILFHGNDEFDNPWKAFVKTVVMMMGEYDYNDLFAPMDKNNSMLNHTNSRNDKSILLPITSKIIFLVFLMLASIVLMNLIIGLAVIDVQELLNEGLVRRLMKQVEFVTHLEQVTTHWIFRSRLMPGSLRKILESKNTIPTQIDLGSSARHCKHPRGISEQLVETLFELASKNRNHHKKIQRASSHDDDGDNLTETIIYLQEVVKKLQRKKMRIQEMQSPKSNVERPGRSGSF